MTTPPNRSGRVVLNETIFEVVLLGAMVLTALFAATHDDRFASLAGFSHVKNRSVKNLQIP